METQLCLNWSVLVEEAKQGRKSRKITQKRLAMLAEVSTPTVSRFENEEKDIQLSSALRILKILGLIDKKNLSFNDPKPYYDPNRELVIFMGDDDGKQIQCSITREALDDHYSDLGNEPIKNFIKYHEKIEQLARRKYIANVIESDGTIVIKTTDI